MKKRSSLDGQLTAALSDLRLDAKLTEDELADISGLSEKVIRDSEAGRRHVDVVELSLWTHACGTTLEEFVQKLDSQLVEQQLPGLLRARDRVTGH